MYVFTSDEREGKEGQHLQLQHIYCILRITILHVCAKLKYIVSYTMLSFSSYNSQDSPSASTTC